MKIHLFKIFSAQISTSQLAMALLGMGLALSAGLAEAKPITPDPLHGFCYGNATCTDNGTVTPTTTQTHLDFGFNISTSGSTSGDLWVYILVPNNDMTPTTHFSVGYTAGGLLHNVNTASTGIAASEVSTTPWSTLSGPSHLVDYLIDPTHPSTTIGQNLGSGAPTNPIGSYMPSTLSKDSSATGYYAYGVDLGQQDLQNNPGTLPGPLLYMTSSSSTLMLGAVIVGFLNTGSASSPNWISTAQSGAIFEAPEPMSLFLFGAGLFALCGAARILRQRP